MCWHEVSDTDEMVEHEIMSTTTVRLCCVVLMLFKIGCRWLDVFNLTSSHCYQPDRKTVHHRSKQYECAISSFYFFVINILVNILTQWHWTLIRLSISDALNFFAMRLYRMNCLSSSIGMFVCMNLEFCLNETCSQS